MFKIFDLELFAQTRHTKGFFEAPLV